MESSLDRGSANLVKPGEVGDGRPGDVRRISAEWTSECIGGGMGGMGGGMGGRMAAAIALGQGGTRADDGLPGRGLDAGPDRLRHGRRGGAGAAPIGGGRWRSSGAGDPVGSAPTWRRTSSRRCAPTSPTPPSGPPSLATGADGTAEVSVDLPESLTTWKVKTWALGQGTKVGQGETEVVTAKDLLVRLQAPRFFVQKDEVVLSANVHNALGHKKSVRVVLELDGGCLKALGDDVEDGRDRRQGGGPGRLAGQGRPRGRGRRPDEGAHRTRNPTRWR